ncbi:MAG: Stp1/IreP family PP2C-type Ser/Thr phosphatase [Solirubrobacteraceae bacterium]|nr:Stp1/IreP family PP2C-type Ser/Thr phosphatase [Solirubrobacteraceae bacterium]
MLRVSEYASVTDTGRQRRANEDSYYARTPVFVVADGMGGAQAGEVASAAAVEAFQAGLPDTPPEQALTTVIQDANARIHEMSREDIQRAGMGTTVTAVHVGEHDVAVAHVGDSRAYRWRDGQLERLTEDHSLVEELRRQGKLTAEEAEEHPQRSIITRALGPEPSVEVDTASWRAQAGDLYLVCSDGLTSMVGEGQLAEILGSTRDTSTLEALARRLVAAANEAGGKDNITVVVFRIEEVGGTAAAPSDEQTTVAGDDAPTAAQVRAAVEDADTARSEAEARRMTPRPPGAPEAERVGSTRGRRILIGLGVFFFLGLPILLGGWFASQSVYFVGSDDGFVAMYRGVPYDLPFGLDLYSVNYTSGVPVEAIPEQQRGDLLDHALRSRDDAADLINQLEKGQLTSSSSQE